MPYRLGYEFGRAVGFEETTQKTELTRNQHATRGALHATRTRVNLPTDPPGTLASLLARRHPKIRVHRSNLHYRGVAAAEADATFSEMDHNGSNLMTVAKMQHYAQIRAGRKKTNSAVRVSRPRRDAGLHQVHRAHRRTVPRDRYA